MLLHFRQIPGRVIRHGLAQKLQRPSRFLAAGVEDHGMWCRFAFFALFGEFLFQFLAGTQADELDLDVRRAHYLDHLSRQVGDGDGAAHLQDVGAVALGHGPGLQDQGYRLRDGHEVTDHVGVRDRDGAAGLYLLAEGRDDGAAAAEHVPEPDRGVDGLGIFEGESLDDHLGQAFGRTHHVDRVYGLVGRDVDKLVRPVGPGSAGDVEGAKDVVHDGLGRLQLHHRNVFVGGRVEDELRLEGLEGEADPLRVRDIADEDLRVVEVLAPELRIQVVQAALVPVEQDQLRGAEA